MGTPDSNKTQRGINVGNGHNFPFYKHWKGLFRALQNNTNFPEVIADSLSLANLINYLLLVFFYRPLRSSTNVRFNPVCCNVYFLWQQNNIFILLPCSYMRQHEGEGGNLYIYPALFALTLALFDLIFLYTCFTETLPSNKRVRIERSLQSTVTF